MQTNKGKCKTNNGNRTQCKSLAVSERLSVFTLRDYSRLRTEKWPRQDGCRRGTRGRLAEEERQGGET